MDQQISKFTMLLIYLTGWEETPKKSNKEKKVFRAFKGYRYEALQELENQGLIRFKDCFQICNQAVLWRSEMKDIED